MTIVEVLRMTRARSGLTHEALEEKTGISQSQLSKVERGKSGLSFARIDRWIEVCGYELRAVPREGANDVDELRTLTDADREIVIRLGRLLPDLVAAHRSTLTGLVDHWEREGGQPVLTQRETDQASAIKSS